MTIATAPGRVCSTAGCRRECASDWAVCPTCTDRLLREIGRPREPLTPDLAVGPGAGASRDERQRLVEAPDPRVGPSVPAGTRHAADVDDEGAVGRNHRAGRASPHPPGPLDTPQRPGAEPQGVTRSRTAGGPRATAVVSDVGQPDGDSPETEWAIASATPGRTAPA